MTRQIVIVLVSMYLGAGFFAGFLMQRAIPPLNAVGITFIAATWPNQIRCARVSSGCEAIPAWGADYFFTFEEPRP